MDNHIIKAINNEENELSRLSVIFTKQSLNLTLLHTSDAWNAQVDNTKIHKLAEEHNINVNEYYEKLKDYFRQTTDDVEYKFNNNVFTLNLLLKNSMKIVYFSCELRQVDFKFCVYNLLDKLYFEKQESNERLTKVSQERLEFEKSKNEYENKLYEFIRKKKTDEEELYNSFVLILNEKKKRIQHLNELLLAFRRGRPTVNPPVEVKKKKSKKGDPKPQAKIKTEALTSESDVDDASENYNTDDEKEKSLLQSSDDDFVGNTSRYNEPGPSTSKDNLDFLLDDSPPRRNLPKRIKSEVSSNDNNINKSSTYKQSVVTKKSNNEEVEDVHMEKTPSVNFSTQDLLDNL